jgi:hypothetical protein
MTFLIRHRDQKCIDTDYPTEYDGEDDEVGVLVYDGPKEPTDEWLKANGYGRHITDIQIDRNTERTVHVGPFWDGEAYHNLVAIPKETTVKQGLPAALAVVEKRRKEIPGYIKGSGIGGWAERPLDWKWTPTGFYA